MKNLKILIAEDDEVAEKFLTIAVQKFGKEIINVKTGIDAVEVCCNNPDIDLVLMDIKMPEMDGIEAIRQIRLFNPNILIIAQTAFTLDNSRKNSFFAGCDYYLSKPFSKAELHMLIEKEFKEQIK